jgi:hypothetical protein
MKLILSLMLVLGVWSLGDTYIDRVDKLIDCQLHGRLKACVEEVRREGMSARDLKLALQDVRNATRR